MILNFRFNLNKNTLSLMKQCEQKYKVPCHKMLDIFTQYVGCYLVHSDPMIQFLQFRLSSIFQTHRDVTNTIFEFGSNFE